MHKIPEPAALEIKRSNSLSLLIKQKIKEQAGAIRFADYMQYALYTPELGFYNSKNVNFGASGDFVTAPQISDLFSRTLARQIVPVITGIEQPDILEFGAGSGIMAAELMLELERMDALPQTYLILETSKYLQQLQKKTIQETCSQHVEKFKWLNKMPNTFKGLVLANEVMDAMPANRFIIEAGKSYELLVTDKFEWARGDEIKIELPYEMVEYPDGYVSEYTELPASWVKSLMSILQQGLVLLIDYGYEDFEYYHPGRKTGTLNSFYRHHKLDDPFFFPGLADLSVHVNFTEIAKVAEICAFLYQSEFLIYGGISELAENFDDVMQRAMQSQQIQKLTAPDKMGETVKVVALCKGIDAPQFIKEF